MAINPKEKNKTRKRTGVYWYNWIKFKLRRGPLGKKNEGEEAMGQVNI